MRCLLMVLLLLSLAGTAMASVTGSTSDTIKDPGIPCLNPNPPIRVTGDTVTDPFILPSLHCTVTGTTAGFVNDYDETCPYTGSTAPDVVYAYTPAEGTWVDFDLCYSGYDTKLYVYEDAVTPGFPRACNDDYYFAAPCPPGALVEGEPTCQDGYTDNYNGGCNSTPVVWQSLAPQAGGCATMCGKSCTYVSGGLSNRDTDWYLSVAPGGLVTATCTAEFPLQFILFTATDCAGLTYILGTGDGGVPVTLPPTNFAENADCAFWVGNQGFSGWPESNFVGDVFYGPGTLCVPSPCEPVPTVSKSWGGIKAFYR